MTNLYPFRFSPLYRHYLWGGQRFKTLLGRDLEPNQIYAESWEIVDHDQDQSIVQYGPLRGVSLHQLMTKHKKELLGSNSRAKKTEENKHTLSDRFPLLFKYLDANQNLSLQVHPDDAMAARLDPPDLGKTEAWYVVAAEPGSRIYAGLKPGVDRTTFAHALVEGTCEPHLHWFEPQPGDALLIPAGTVHALGAGILLAEIQQASDTTFRLFDWGRLGLDGKPRTLHIEQGLEAIDFDRGAGEPVRSDAVETNKALRIIECDHFTLSRWNLTERASLGGDGHCHLISVIEGEVSIDGDPADTLLRRGQTILLPAAGPPSTVRPGVRATLLDIQVP